MSYDQTLTGAALTVTDVPDVRTRAALAIKRLARDESDELLLRDVVLDEKPIIDQPRPKPKATAAAAAAAATKAKSKTKTTRGKRRRSRSTVMVDAGPARLHVQDLVATHNMTLAAIATAANVSPSSVHRLLYGPSTTRPTQGSIHVDRLARILAVQYTPPAPLKRCAQGRPFTPVGYRVGRCEDCGQLAPQRDGLLHAHPHPKEREA